jgi:hypothetical protein
MPFLVVVPPRILESTSTPGEDASLCGIEDMKSLFDMTAEEKPS